MARLYATRRKFQTGTRYLANILLTANELIYSRKFYVAIAAAVAVGVILFAPVMPFKTTEQYVVMQNSTESYQVTEVHQEAYQEAQTQQVPYTVTTQMSSDLGGYENYLLKPASIRYWSGYVPQGAKVEYVYSAEKPIDFFISASADGSPLSAATLDSADRMSFKQVTAQSYFHGTFNADRTGTYYFIMKSLDNSNSTSVLYARSIASWNVQTPSVRSEQVMVTKYHDVNGPVTLQRSVQVPVTKTREASTTTSVFRYFTGIDVWGQILDKAQAIPGLKGLIPAAKPAPPQASAPSAASPPFPTSGATPTPSDNSQKSAEERQKEYQKLVQQQGGDDSVIGQANKDLNNLSPGKIGSLTGTTGGTVDCGAC